MTRRLDTHLIATVAAIAQRNRVQRVQPGPVEFTLLVLAWRTDAVKARGNDQPWFTAAHLAALTGASPAATATHLRRLADAQLVTRSTWGKPYQYQLQLGGDR